MDNEIKHEFTEKQIKQIDKYIKEETEKYIRYEYKEKKMKNIDKILSDETLLNDAICSACYILKNGYNCDADKNITCNYCEFATGKNCIKFLNKEYIKHNIKLTTLEYDMLKIETTKSYPFRSYAYHMDLKNRGHFKGITDLSMTFQEILDNCEIID